MTTEIFGTIQPVQRDKTIFNAEVPTVVPPVRVVPRGFWSYCFLFVSFSIELIGDLAGIPALTAGSKKPVSHRDGLRATLVAGETQPALLHVFRARNPALRQRHRSRSGTSLGRPRFAVPVSRDATPLPFLARPVAYRTAAFRLVRTARSRARDARTTFESPYCAPFMR